MFSPWQMQPGYPQQPAYQNPAYPGPAYQQQAYPGPAYQHPGYVRPIYPAYAPPAHRPAPPVTGRLQLPLTQFPAGAFPVPESIHPQDFPPAVQASLMRLIEGPPKPSVTPPVMNEAQRSMIAPDLPTQSNA